MHVGLGVDLHHLRLRQRPGARELSASTFCRIEMRGVGAAGEQLVEGLVLGASGSVSSATPST